MDKTKEKVFTGNDIAKSLRHLEKTFLESKLDSYIISSKIPNLHIPKIGHFIEIKYCMAKKLNMDQFTM